MPQDWFAQYAVRPSAPAPAAPREDDWFSQFTEPTFRTSNERDRDGRPVVRPHRTEDYMDPTPDQGSAAWRFASNLGEMINPVAIVTGAYNAVRHPIDTGKALIEGQRNQYDKARTAFGEGRYSEAAGHAGAAVLPVIGPLAAEAGEQIGSGDIAGGLGKTAGMLVPFGAAEGLSRAGVKAIPKRAATRLEQGAAERVADVILPRANTNVGRRMGNKAQKIAPQLSKDAELTGNWTRQGLHERVAAKLTDAEVGLDAASDARLNARTFETKPIIDELKQRRARLTSQAVVGSRRVPSIETVSDAPRPRATGRDPSLTKPSFDTPSFDAGPAPKQVKVARPIGQDVTPKPNSVQAAQIDQAIAEIEALGPVARYESIRRIREAYDGPAKTVYNPSLTADFLAKRGESLGAADVTGTLRAHLAKWDPETAVANAEYSLYKSAKDILDASAEIERVRPKVGRQIMARLTGTLFGGQQAGVAGGVAGYMLGPIADQALASGFTTKLQSARLMQDMAAAIRKGDVGRVTSLNFKLRQLMKQVDAATTRGHALQQPQPEGSR